MAKLSTFRPKQTVFARRGGRVLAYLVKRRMKVDVVRRDCLTEKHSERLLAAAWQRPYVFSTETETGKARNRMTYGTVVSKENAGAIKTEHDYTDEKKKSSNTKRLTTTIPHTNIRIMHAEHETYVLRGTLTRTKRLWNAAHGWRSKKLSLCRHSKSQIV